MSVALQPTTGAAPVATGYVLVGPTAVGKSRVAQWIAERQGWVILSADSMLVYRGMDVGTAKPSSMERARVPYYGVDVVSPTERYSAAEWLSEARRAFGREPAVPVLVVGGTGLYLRCLVDGLREGPPPDAEARARWQRVLDTDGVDGLREALRAVSPAALEQLADGRNPRRLMRALERVAAGEVGGPSRSWSAGAGRSPLVGLRMAPDAHKSIIESRVRDMYAHGLVEEARRLLDAGGEWSATAGQAIGYAEAMAHLRGQCTLAAAMERTMARTRQYAKRQRTWLNRQATIEWIEGSPGMDVATVGAAVLRTWERLGPTPLLGIRR